MRYYLALIALTLAACKPPAVDDQTMVTRAIDDSNATSDACFILEFGCYKTEPLMLLDPHTRYAIHCSNPDIPQDEWQESIADFLDDHYTVTVDPTPIEGPDNDLDYTNMNIWQPYSTEMLIVFDRLYAYRGDPQYRPSTWGLRYYGPGVYITASPEIIEELFRCVNPNHRYL
jgi:hypothetical protein